MNKNKVFLVISSILIPLFLIFLSYQLVFNFSHYNQDQQNVINFLNDKQELNNNITSEELSHLDDVKSLMTKINYFFYFLLIFLFLIFIYYRKNKSELKNLLLYGGVTSIIFIFILIFFSLISFNGVFTIFHRLFFPQGNWMFNLNSFLIQTFPLKFFISFFTKITALSLLLASIFILISFFIKFRSKV